LGVYYAVNYYGRLRAGEQQTAHLQIQLAQANLRALKMQLHPHFLFNTLNSVAALVRKNENKTAIRMLVQLSDFLRLALENKGLHEIPVAQEVEFVQKYLAIEKIRFQERLSVAVSVDEAASGAFVPNMILQPIVENAIHHGIGSNAKAGRIEITASTIDDRLQLSVRDNGAGMKQTVEPRPGRGVGLSNTRERLENLYDDDYSLTFSAVDSGGLDVVISIPFRSRPVIQNSDRGTA
ncbi:MAG: histidine kinase, partial [Rhodothermales bacterium]|nr:histidine kinase [Rhodothermales bacterium]